MRKGQSHPKLEAHVKLMILLDTFGGMNFAVF